MDNATRFENLVKEFLKKNNNYELPIKNFLKFLKATDLDEKIFILNENNIDDFFDFALINNIGTEAQVTVHISALKALFSYLIDNNLNFSGLNGYISTPTFREKWQKKVDKTVNKQILPKELLNKILVKIDDYLEDKKNIDFRTKTKEQTYFETQISRLFIKLSLIIPLKASEMLNLCVGDLYYQDKRYIEYNGIKIKIPNNLRKEILFTIDYAVKRYDKKYLHKESVFSFLYGCIDKKADTATLNNMLTKVYRELELEEMLQKREIGKKKKYIYPAECYKLTAIANLLESGINIVYLTKLTGKEMSTLISGFDLEKKIPLRDNVSININSSLISCDFYEYL